MSKCVCGAKHPRGANYYVTVVDGPNVGTLVGPFKTHSAALAMVEPAKTLAQKLNRKAFFFSFGTAAFKSDFKRPGLLNKQLGLP